MNVYISIRGEQKGPYALSQVQTMWNNGVITADALYCMEGGKEWRPVRELSFQELPSAKPVRAARKPRRRVLLFAVGTIVVLILLLVAWTAYQNHRENEAMGKAVGEGVASGIEDAAKSVIVKKLQDSVIEGFSEQLMNDPQGFLDTGIRKSFAALNLDPQAPSGFTATSAKVDYARIIWRDDSAQAIITNTVNNFSGSTVVYTINWKNSDGKEGHCQFEQSLDRDTGKVISFKMLEIK